MKKKRILIVFGTEWDQRQLDGCRPAWEASYEVEYAVPPDADCPWDLDVVAWIEREVRERRGHIDGVFSSSDYPGATVAGALATALSLPGSSPERLLTAAHKFYSRRVQEAARPDAVPRFAIVDPTRPETWEPSFGFPCFVKPVKGAFSVLARRADDRAGIEELMTSQPTRHFLDTWMGLFDRLVAHYTEFELGGRFFIAEELLVGKQVTVDGYVQDGAVHLLGIVDSSFYEGTTSFSRFDCPSSLPDEVQGRMAAISVRVIEALELANGLFNVELVWDSREDAVKILEVNPRIAGQFADLYQKLQGVHAYELALALAAGQAPPERTHGAHATATSFPLRVFGPTRVRRAPTQADVAAAEALFPDTQVWLECADGDELCDASLEDGASQRYAIINLGAPSREEATRRCRIVVERLGFELEPVAT